MKRAYWDLKYLNQIKAQYKEELKRVASLPEDYQQAFQDITEYLTTNYGGFDGLDLMATQIRLIDLLEEVAAQQIPAKEFVGDDVTAFAKEFGQASDLPNWQERYFAKRQEKLNKRIQRKLGGKKDETHRKNQKNDRK